MTNPSSKPIQVNEQAYIHATRYFAEGTLVNVTAEDASVMIGIAVSESEKTVFMPSVIVHFTLPHFKRFVHSMQAQLEILEGPQEVPE